MDFWPNIVWITAALALAYLTFELGRMTRPGPENLGPAEPARPKRDPKPEPEPELEPTAEELGVPEWVLEWGKSLRVNLKPRDLDDLHNWGLTIVEIAHTQFGGGVSAKCHLYPMLRADDDNSEYAHIPVKWRSLHALENLQSALRRAGLVDMTCRRKGLTLTEAAINEWEFWD